MQKITEIDIKLIEEKKARVAAKNNLLAFTCYTKPNYKVNCHHEVMCHALDDFAAGKIKNLMISAPTRHGKSELVSRRLPAFIFGKYPDRKIIATSYADSLAWEMTKDVQRIMDSNLYNNIFPDTNLLNDRIKLDKRERWIKTLRKFEIVRKEGTYRGSGIRGGIAGKGCDYLLIDDYLKNYKEAQSKTIKNEIWNEYLNTLSYRLEGAKQTLITATRGAADDLHGRILKTSKKEPSLQPISITNSSRLTFPLKYLTISGI